MEQALFLIGGYRLLHFIQFVHDRFFQNCRFFRIGLPRFIGIRQRMPRNDHMMPVHLPAHFGHIQTVVNALFNLLFVTVRNFVQIVPHDQHARNAYDPCDQIQHKHLERNSFDEFHAYSPAPFTTLYTTDTFLSGRL